MKPQRTTNASLEGRVCVITGADSGVGFETSKQLARSGAHLVMVCRDLSFAESAIEQVRSVATGPVDAVHGELSVLQGVRRLADALLDAYPRIHVLINNAGIMFNTRATTADGYERVFAVNYLAPFLLTNLLLDRMKHSAPARILNVSSEGHRFGGLDMTDLHWHERRFSGMKAYGASKVALNSFTRQLSERLEGSNVTVNAAHPGEVYSNIGMENGRVYLWIRKHVLNRMLKPTAISGQALHYLVASPDLDHVSGEYFNMTHQEEPHGLSFSPDLGKALWRRSEELTGLSGLVEPRAVPGRPAAPA